MTNLKYFKEKYLAKPLANIYEICSKYLNLKQNQIVY